MQSSWCTYNNLSFSKQKYQWILKNKNILDKVKETNIHWVLCGFYALTNDLISMEHYNSQLHLTYNHYDHDINEQVLVSLDKIQRVYGKFEFIH